MKHIKVRSAGFEPAHKPHLRTQMKDKLIPYNHQVCYASKYR